MNAVLWTLQVVLALHTTAGALWKLANSERATLTLGAIPHDVWLALSVFELLCVAGLVVPVFVRRLAVLVPLAIAGIAAEMLGFIAVHLATGHPLDGQVAYWTVVAVFCAFIAYGRVALRPLGLQRGDLTRRAGA